MFPLVRDLAADSIPVAVTCRVLGFAKQAFYNWNANPVTQRDWNDAHLIHAAREIHHDDPGFGYRYIRDELAEQGIVASRNRVNRLCTQQRLWSVHSRKRGLNRKPGPPVHDDLVLRDFTAAAPNELWLTDITEHPTAEGKLYLCAIKDACSRRIVGYSIDSQMTAALAVNALRNALALRGHLGAIVHSDRGSQGGLNRSLQHLEREVLHALREQAEAGPCLSGSDSLTGTADGGLAGGPGPVLGRDRERPVDRRRGGRGRRVVSGGLPLVSPLWRGEANAPANGVRSLSVVP